MKKFYIIVFLFYSSYKLFSFIPEGLYLSPKFIYSIYGKSYIKENGKKGFYNYLGGGFSLGLSIPTMNQSSPVRFEFEYMNRVLVDTIDKFNIHTFLGSVYFDINLFLIRDPLTPKMYRETLLNKYPPFSIFFGISIGNKMYDSLIDKRENYRLSKNILVFGFSGGFAFNVIKFMSIDIGYRYLIDIEAKGYHEIIFGLRFKVPKIKDKK